MPKIRKPPPPGILQHLLLRFREGRIQASDILELKHWLESDPTVPEGKWFKRFRTGTLAGKGELPATFLAPGMSVEGEEIE
jgi:hypothetical protein